MEDVMLKSTKLGNQDEANYKDSTLVKSSLILV